MRGTLTAGTETMINSRSGSSIEDLRPSDLYLD